jgi:hypothetical protein
MKPLDANLPMGPRQVLANGKILPGRTMGAALPADIPGFIPRAQALDQELGLQRSAEGLADHLIESATP